MVTSWSTEIASRAQQRYREWDLDALPAHLRRNSLDYYYLSVWPGLRQLEPVADGTLPAPGRRVEYAYVHIPFCSGVCDFCSYFLTTTADAEKDPRVTAYVDTLIAQARIHQRQTELALSHIYLGGGTPSVLHPDQVAHLLDGLAGLGALSPGLIGTMEFHPELFDDPRRLDRMLDVLDEYRIRRISIGFQSHDRGILDATNRRHGPGFLTQAASRLRDRGFLFNVDLMYGLPRQSLAAWVASIEAVLAVRPDSVSTYFTFVDYGTKLWRAVRKDPTLLSAHSDIQACHIAAQIALEEAGYLELPNDFYSLPDGDPASFRQRSLPSDAGSLALGAGGYGYYSGMQYFNQFNFAAYARAVAEGRPPIWRAAVLSPHEVLCRDIMFSFKNSPEVNISLFVSRHGTSPLESHRRVFDELAALALVDLRPDLVRLTPKGRLVVEEIACMFASARPDGPTGSTAERHLVGKHNYAPTYSRLRGV
jgi:coproporphyrinogen III oxidase-like Fe-S oxidoreductase